MQFTWKRWKMKSKISKGYTKQIVEDIRIEVYNKLWFPLGDKLADKIADEIVKILEKKIGKEASIY